MTHIQGDPSNISRTYSGLKSIIFHRWLFLLLSTIIMVFYSEKMYWYIQGYLFLELVLFYIIGVYLLFWTISYFKVNHFWPLVLASVSYPLYVEGLFTGIITFDISFVIMLSYFVGWHSTLSVLIGWYYHRKCLIEDNKIGLILSSSILGILWGLWSIIYWTPTQINDPDFISESFRVGQWTISEFTIFAFYLVIIYIISHLLISKGRIWQSSFKPTKVENSIVFIILIAFFILQVFTAGIFSILLLLHFFIVFSVLKKYKNKRTDDLTILSSLSGDIKLKNLLFLILMPVTSISIYTIFFYIDPPIWFIDNIIYWGIVGIQVLYGFILYTQSIIKTIKWDPSSIEIVKLS